MVGIQNLVLPKYQFSMRKAGSNYLLAELNLLFVGYSHSSLQSGNPGEPHASWQPCQQQQSSQHINKDAKQSNYNMFAFSDTLLFKLSYELLL